MGKRLNSICFVSQFPPPMHGLAKAVETLYNSKLRDIYSFSKVDITNNWNFLKSCWNILWSKADMFYIVIAQSIGGNVRDLLFLLFMLIKRKKIVIHIHGGYFGHLWREDMSKLQVFFNKKILSKVDAAIALGDSLRWMYNGLVSEDKVFVVPNCIDNQFCNDIDRKWERQKSKNRIEVLYLSNMIPTKGFHYILDAANYLKSNGFENNFVFHFAGKYYDPDEETYFNDYVKNNDLFDMVKYHGIVGGDVKNKLLNDSDIFILPTTYKLEGQPISILEAMGNGLFIITTNHAGICDISTSDNGLILDKNNIDYKQIADCLVECYNNRDYLISVSQKNFRFANEIFTESNYIDNMNNVFEHSLS